MSEMLVTFNRVLILFRERDVGSSNVLHSLSNETDSGERASLLRVDFISFAGEVLRQNAHKTQHYKTDRFQ